MKTHTQTRPPALWKIIRAPFLSSIIAPILIGTAISCHISGTWHWPGFLLVMALGIFLHAATNVYNDIYDTKQGTDGANLHRNEFSGGSGILLNHPEVLPDMFRTARISLLAAVLTTLLLMNFIDRSLWLWLWILCGLSVFFSKYYTAAPVKLAYRGFGEISVWFAFGPMAILVAAVGQNNGFRPEIIWAMPPTGLSTLSILLIGQLIDLQADRHAGKLGVAARVSTRFTAWLYVTVQLLIVLNVIMLSVFVLDGEWILLIALIPYALLFPKTMPVVLKFHDQPDRLKPAAAMNVQIHLAFSLLLFAGLLISILL